MSQCVTRKSAIVTGAGSGINLAFAQLLLSKGCNVLLADLRLRPESQKVVDDYNAPSNELGRAVFQETDVRSWVHLSRMFDAAEKEFGRVDIVCPGAGVYEPVRLENPTSTLVYFIMVNEHRNGAASGTHLAAMRAKISMATRKSMLTSFTQFGQVNLLYQST